MLNVPAICLSETIWVSLSVLNGLDVVECIRDMVKLSATRVTVSTEEILGSGLD